MSRGSSDARLPSPRPTQPGATLQRRILVLPHHRRRIPDLGSRPRRRGRYVPPTPSPTRQQSPISYADAVRGRPPAFKPEAPHLQPGPIFTAAPPRFTDWRWGAGPERTTYQASVAERQPRHDDAPRHPATDPGWIPVRGPHWWRKGKHSTRSQLPPLRRHTRHSSRRGAPGGAHSSRNGQRAAPDSPALQEF